MESKYAGKCQVCQNAWNAGDNIFYQGTPKVICANKECFLEQGGKEYTGKSFGGGSGGSKSSYTPARSIEQKLSDIIILDEQVSKIATERLLKIEESVGKLEPEQRLVFIESWARTLTMSFNQR
jgi:hypothetical protein